MTRRDFLRRTGVGLAGTLLFGERLWASGPSLPNIVYILADDLGYGDVGCLNPECKIPTPNIDRLAAEGVVFTDAHAGSAVCTPTRYGVLTGRYSWRSRLQRGVLWGYSPPLIPPERLTVARLLKEAGYHTAGFGKWHLGLGWQTKDGGVLSDNSRETGDKIDYGKPILGGPTALGFDTFFGIPASLDMVPYVYIEDDHVLEPPTGHVEGRRGYAFFRSGPIAPGFKHEEVLPTLLERAVGFVERHVRQQLGKPFFVYFPLTAPHTPILPTPDFQGKSGIGPYGDFVMEVDWVVGQVLDALDRTGVSKNTLVIFTSDNGCSPAANFKHLAEYGHFPSYHFRGYKADIYEGGHRIPFVARWPGHIKPGTTCDDTICLTDLMRTTAAIVGKQLPDNAAEDSYNILPDLLGTATSPIREATVHHSINGSFSIRRGKWKLELCPGSGGWSDPRPKKARELHLPKIQLYDMTQDVGERRNVADQYPWIVYELTALLDSYVKRGRSTPGAPQQNDVEVDIWRVVRD